MAEFFVRAWHALTAAGRMFALGTFEAVGFWSTTLLLLGVFIFSMEIAGGVAWRMIEGRLRPKLRDKDAEARLHAEIQRLQAALYVATEERRKLEATVGEQRRVINVRRSFNRNWNSDAARVAAGAGR